MYSARLTCLKQKIKGHQGSCQAYIQWAGLTHILHKSLIRIEHLPYYQQQVNYLKQLFTRLAPVLSKHLIIKHQINNHIQIITQLSTSSSYTQCFYVVAAQVKFSLFRRDGDSNRFLSSWRGIASTHLSIPREGSFRSPLAQVRNKFAGPISAAPLGMPIYQGQDSNLTPRSYAIDSPHILATNRGAYLNQRGIQPELTHRLHGRNDLSGQLSVRHAFNMTRGHTAYRSLSDTDGDRSILANLNAHRLE